MKYGFFGQATRSYLDNRLDFSIGFRMDADSYTTASNLIQNFSPRMSFSYGLTEDQRWKINGSVGRYYKIPTYTMLGYQDRMRVFVNQNLRYTQSDHWVAGLEHNLGPAARLTVEGFYKNYSQYPVSVRDGVALANKGGGFEVLGNEPVTSDGKGRAYGLELLYQQKLSGNFYGTFAYTYFYSQFTGQSGTFLPSVWDSRHLMSFTGGYKLKRNWELSARWRYAGQTPYVPVNQSATLDNYPEIVLDYTRLGDELLNPFSQVDVRLDKKWNFSQYSLNLYFDFQNFLAQATPAPDDFGLARDAEGALLLPRQLVRIANDDQNNVPIPSFGIVVDF
jgi:outer membrane receptor for ferrienterochelin and colicin